jgi:hypothetical protein
MPTAIRVTRHGEHVGSCTASCYDAVPASRCVCICGGANHGVGRLEAMGRAHELAALQIECDTSVHPEADQTLLGGVAWAKNIQ